MRYIAKIETPEPLVVVIEYDTQAGYYIYIYKNSTLAYDYLQDTLEIAKEFAKKHFHVPLNAWKNDNAPLRLESSSSSPDAKRYVLVNDIVEGPYLLIYQQQNRINDIQDTRFYYSSLEEGKNFCLHHYNIPLTAWKEA